MNAQNETHANAAWALQAWKSRRSDPELKRFVGKYVAVYGEKIIASGDEFGSVLDEALRLSGAEDEQSVLIDYWGNDSSFHESLEE